MVFELVRCVMFEWITVVYEWLRCDMFELVRVLSMSGYDVKHLRE